MRSSVIMAVEERFKQYWKGELSFVQLSDKLFMSEDELIYYYQDFIFEKDGGLL